MKTFVRVALIVFVILIAIPGGLLKLYFIRADAKTDQFYQARPILQAMRSVQHGGSSGSETARAMLWGHVPLGTEVAAAVAALSKEGFDCRHQPVKRNSAEDKLEERAAQMRQTLGLPRENGKRMVCQLGVSLALGYTTWIVDMDFDETDRLTNSRVATWNIFL